MMAEVMQPRYGIWNDYKKEFQFGISEPTKYKAIMKLRNKIGWDATKARFQARRLPDNG